MRKEKENLAEAQWWSAVLIHGFMWSPAYLAENQQKWTEDQDISPSGHMVAPINLSLQTEAHMTTYTPTRASLTYSCAVNIEACLATVWIQEHGQGFISLFCLYSFHKHFS